MKKLLLIIFFATLQVLGGDSKPVQVSPIARMTSLISKTNIGLSSQLVNEIYYWGVYQVEKDIGELDNFLELLSQMNIVPSSDGKMQLFEIAKKNYLTNASYGLDDFCADVSKLGMTFSGNYKNELATNLIAM